MNILILNWKDIKNPQAGGAEVIAFELAKRLVQKGNTVTFFTRGFPNCLPEEIIDGIHVVRKGNWLTVFLHVFFFYKRLAVKPDKVIDMINTIGWFTPFYVSRKKRIAYLNQLAKEVWFYEFSLPLALVGYVIERMQYFFYRSTKFLCYSESTKADLISFKIPRKNIFVFPIGIDQKRYYPGRKSSFPIFLFVARLVKMKRADVCIKAMHDVVAKHKKAKLAIVGNGREEKALAQLVENLSLERNVFFINKNNFFYKKNTKDSKVKLMQESWGLLLPSVKEGWGLVVTEAGACKTPSIVSGVTGLKDSVINKKTGIILSKSPTETELAMAMNQLIENKNEREKMSVHARLYAKKFTWEKSFSFFYQYIQTV